MRKWWLAGAGILGAHLCILGCGGSQAGALDSSVRDVPAADGSRPRASVPHVLVFVQTDKDPGLNRLIVERGLWPIVNCVTARREGFRIEIVPLFDRTTRAPVLFQGEARPGLKGMAQANAIRTRFIANGRELLNKVYAPEASQFIDILGSVFVIDDYVTRHDVVPHVVYVSDMVQQTGDSGCDFSGAMNGRDIRQCTRGIEREYGAKLHQRQRLAGMRVDIAKVNLRDLARGIDGVPDTPEITTPDDEIDAFWRDQFFGKMLQAHVTRHDAAAVPCDRLGWARK